MLANNATSTQSIELMPNTLAGIIDWDTLDQMWYAIQHSENTQWYFHNNDASTAGYVRLNEVNTSTTQRTKTPTDSRSLDARRMGCPLPLVHTARSLRRLAVGEILEIVTIEPGSVNDIGYLCKCTGSKHIALAEGEYGYSLPCPSTCAKNGNSSSTVCRTRICQT